MIYVDNETQVEEYYNHFPLSDFFSFDIRPFVKVVRFEADELILKEGEIPEYLFYLMDGRAKLFLTHDNGRISLVNFLSAPCFIGEMEMLEAQEYANGVKAITVCTCFAIQSRLCKERMLQDTKFLRYICVFLSKKEIANTENYSRNQSISLEVRLARFTLNVSNKGYYREKHTEVSEYLGVTYRHLLYVLADFVKGGILKKTLQGYHIEKMEMLKELASQK